MNIAIFGAGYVGCVTAGCLAKLGHRVWLVEVSPEKLETLRAGHSPVVEPGLDELLRPALRTGQIVPTGHSTEAVAATELGMICVGTPSGPDGTPNTSYLKKVLNEIAGALTHRTPHPDPLHGRETGLTSPPPTGGEDQGEGTAVRLYHVVLRSTVPWPVAHVELLPLLAGCPVSLAVNPEFLREGNAIKDFFEPPFIVIGTEQPAAAARLKEVYRDVTAPVFIVSPGSASLLKYACNAFHATKVVFANEIAALARAYGADANEVMDLFCRDTILNISKAYLRPGFAYGGSCLPKDLRALLRIAAVQGTVVPLLAAVPQSNAALIERALEVIEETSARRVALLGLSFKPGTDDLRESPLVVLAERLLGQGYDLRIVDPDVQLDRLTGKNLAYAQQRLQHLAAVLWPKPVAALSDVELMVIGKRLAGLEDILAALPATVPVLDLTRQVTAKNVRCL